MPAAHIPFWKQAPLLRLLLPLILGIMLQWYYGFEWTQIIFAGCSFLAAFIAFQLLPISLRFKLQVIQGLLINLIIVVVGLLLTFQKDTRHQQKWYGNIYHDSDHIVVTINEPLLQKAKSYKAEGIVSAVVQNNSAINCFGKLLLYFERDSATMHLQYGDKILINNNLQQIKNSGNPGAFNYQRYSAFQQIYHQAYLKDKDWILLKEKNVNVLNDFIFKARTYILQILQSYIKGENELGIAEALLIGYKADLDTDLVQAYSNTGVVHIIAISGLHLGLIYFMLVWLFNRIPVLKKSKIVKGCFILLSLWLFALLTGASASVLRSAVMFSFIVGGESFGKRSSIYNSLAVSAFLLLCYNPYFLWDVGFQLSYLAVVGIVIFQKPIYNWVYVKNKWVDKVWKLVAVSLAAQIFTFPICLYYFHQFPNLFLISNLVAVPLSSLILFAEIFLIALAPVAFINIYLGKITTWLIWLMNKFIAGVNSMPFAVYDGISATLFSTMLLYFFVFCIGFWLMTKNRNAFTFSLLILSVFVFLNTYKKWNVVHQQKVIVYNIPQHQAIDFIKGGDYAFYGDSVLLRNGMLQNFHLKPGRIAMDLQNRTDHLNQLYKTGKFFEFKEKRILLIDSSFSFEPLQNKMNVDLIIISKNANLFFPQLVSTFNCSRYVFDASNSLWKIGKWKKDCELLHLPFYSVPENGAFIMDL